MLVAVDGSKLSEEAFQMGLFIAQKMGAKLYVLNVILDYYAYNLGTLAGDAIHQIIDIRGENARNILKNLEEKYQEEYDFEGHIRMGDPAREILDFAEDKEIDLIVMGNKGLGAFSKTLLGSVSNKVVNKFKGSVFVYKKRKKGEEEDIDD